MNRSQLPLAVRVTAAALAVFMTIAMLNGVISIAEPQQSQLIALNAVRLLSRQSHAAATAPREIIVAQAQ
ncbi:MAG: hypothetical protein ACHP83_00490 [Burkholderiales bacterium]